MSLFLLTIAGTLFIIFVLVFLLLGSPGALSARLTKVTSQVRALETPAADQSAVQGVFARGRLVRVLAPLHQRVGFTPDAELVRRLVLAGYRQPEHADIYYSVRILLPLVTVIAVWLLLPQNKFLWTLILGATSFLLPDLWLTRAVSQRRERLRLSLPDALDLLVICMEAGLGLDQALFRVGRELRISHPELSDEFLLVNLEQRAGKPRLEAWRNMADRTGVESVRSFVHMLIQTERFGTPISKSLGVFADALRTRRRQQAEEMAAKTTIKMIPPLVLFIFPSLFIVLLAPAIITIMRNMSKAFGGP